MRKFFILSLAHGAKDFLAQSNFWPGFEKNGENRAEGVKVFLLIRKTLVSYKNLDECRISVFVHGDHRIIIFSPFNLPAGALGNIITLDSIGDFDFV